MVLASPVEQLRDALSTKQLKKDCAPEILKSALQASRWHICRMKVHSDRLQKPDGCAGLEHNTLVISEIVDEVAQA